MANTRVTIPRDARGDILLPGLTKHRTEVDFSWLTSIPATVTTSGAAMGGDGAAGTGKLVLTTAASANAQAVVTLNAGADGASCKSMLVSVDVEWPSAAAPSQVFFGLTASTNSGVLFRGFEKTIRTRAAGSPPSHAIRTTLARSGRSVTTNIAMLIIPSTKLVAFLENDQVTDAVIMDELVTTGTHLGGITIQTLDTTARSASVRRISLQITR